MAKLTQSIFKNMVYRWLRKNRWHFNPEKAEKLIIDNKLEEFPYKPDIFIEKDGFSFWINTFDKEDHFYSKPLQCWVTGFDYWKYKMLIELERATKIPTAILFYSEEDKEFIFKAIRELPNPIIWQRTECLQTQYKRKKYYFKCIECRKDHHNTFHNCAFRKTKIRPMAIWKTEIFRKNTNFQISIL